MAITRIYESMEIQVINQTPDPARVIGIACALTQKRSLDFEPASKKTIQYLYKANHRSILEHVSMTLLVTHVSRSFLAQITRHRMASYTSASQHYQNYSDYPHIIDDKMSDMIVVYDIFDQVNYAYDALVRHGVPVEEARQILPGAKAVNLLWTINASSLAHFLNIRMCERNVKEMRVFANKVRQLAINWFPELFSIVGPDCWFGKCKQGHMQAAKCKKEHKVDGPM